MGRMKELFMEVYEQHDGNIPVDFDFDAYLNQKIKEMQEENDAKMKVSVVQTELVSNCCGANMQTLVSEDGPDFLDLGICPKCHDHCGVEELN